MFLFNEYLRRPLDDPKRISVFNITYTRSIIDHVAIGIETPMIESGCYSEKISLD